MWISDVAALCLICSRVNATVLASPSRSAPGPRWKSFIYGASGEDVQQLGFMISIQNRASLILTASFDFFISKPTHCWIPAHGYIVYIGDVLATGVSRGEGPPANLCLSPVTVMYILGASNGNHTSAPAAFHFDSLLSCKIAPTEINVASSSLFFGGFLLIDCFLIEIILT